MTKAPLSGVRAKIKARNAKRKSPRNSSPTGQRIKMPALPKEPRPRTPKPQPRPVGAPFSRSPEPKGPSETKPQLNRWTKKPHEHRREIARRTGQPVDGLKAAAIARTLKARKTLGR